MWRLFSWIGLGALVASAPALAKGPWYLQGSVGAVSTNDRLTQGIFNGPFGISGRASENTAYSAGPSFEIGGGYKLPAGFRLQGNLGYAHYAVSSITPSSPTIPILDGKRHSVVSGGGRDLLTLTGEALYDLPVRGRVVPFVGAGGGYAHGESQPTYVVVGGNRLRDPGGSPDALMILAEGGLAIRLTDKWSAVPAYRFQHLFTGGPALEDHTFRIGLRYEL